jgi:hypothetical protein
MLAVKLLLGPSSLDARTRLTALASTDSSSGSLMLSPLRSSSPPSVTSPLMILLLNRRESSAHLAAVHERHSMITYQTFLVEWIGPLSLAKTRTIAISSNSDLAFTAAPLLEEDRCRTRVAGNDVSIRMVS